MTGRERFDTFDVTFVFDTTRITTTVMALSPEAAMDMAAEYVARDVNIWPSVLEAAEDVTVMVVDRAVL